MNAPTAILLLAIEISLSAHAPISELMDVYDDAAAVRAFSAIQTPAPEDRARNVEALSRLYRSDEARRAADELMRDAPASPWAWYARATVEDEVENALPASDKMMALAGPNPDDRLVLARVDHLAYVSRYSEVYALLDSRPASLSLQIARAQTLLYDAGEHARPEDGAKAMALLQALADEHPQSAPAQFAAARAFQGRKQPAEAHAYAKRAAELTPSISIHARYWEMLSAAPGLSDAQRRAAFEEDVQSLEKTRGDWPELWVRVARAYRKQFDAADVAEQWETRLLRDAPASAEAATVLYERYLAFMQRNGDPRGKPELLARVIQLLREAIAHPRLAESFRNSASMSLINDLNSDPATTDAELLAALDNAPGLGSDFGSASRMAVLLANRNLRHEQALALARTAIDKAKVMIETGEAREEAVKNRVRAIGHDALGWALLKSGDLVAAHTQLLAANELDPKPPLLQYHLGQWYEVTGKPALAEKAYLRGMAQQSREVNPNEAALAALYKNRHGASRGEQYAKKSRAIGTETRRKQVLASRASAPPAAPTFQLDPLDGKPVSLTALKGKVVVVNFWGIWCGYCVAELPEYQQLKQKYAGDPRVVVLTVNNDGNPDQVRKWMRSKKYDFPVLLDNGFAQKAKVLAWPTTWFIDPQGRMAFKKEGWTEHLLEEFSWRIDALTAR
jgi:thiol-disulfide isomerase/thioredoxin/predicted Zn-dependent protease